MQTQVHEVGLWVPGVSELPREEITTAHVNEALGPFMDRFRVSVARPAIPEDADFADLSQVQAINDEESKRRGYEIGLAMQGNLRPATAEDLLPFVASRETHPALRVELIRFPKEHAAMLGRMATQRARDRTFKPNTGPDMPLGHGMSGSFIDAKNSRPLTLNSTLYDPRTANVVTPAGQRIQAMPAAPHVDNWQRFFRARRLEGSDKRVSMVMHGVREVLFANPSILTMSDVVFDALEAPYPERFTHTKETRLPTSRDFHAYVTHSLGRAVFLSVLLHPGEGYILGTENIVHDGASRSIASGIAFWHYLYTQVGRLPSLLAEDPQQSPANLYALPPHPPLASAAERYHEWLYTKHGTVVIREAGLEDKSSMTRLLASTLVDTYTDEAQGLTHELLSDYVADPEWLWRKLNGHTSSIKDPDAKVCCATLNGKLQGYVVVSRHKNGEQWLEDWQVAKSLQGCGVGAALLRRALSALDRSRPLYVAFAPHANVAGIYEHYGFQRTGRDVSYMQAKLAGNKTIPVVEACLSPDARSALMTKLFRSCASQQDEEAAT